jgi:hypothetical protein
VGAGSDGGNAQHHGQLHATGVSAVPGRARYVWWNGSEPVDSKRQKRGFMRLTRGSQAGPVRLVP